MQEEAFNKLMSLAVEAGVKYFEKTNDAGEECLHTIFWCGPEWSGQAILLGPTDSWAGFTRRAVAPFGPNFVVAAVDSYATEDPEVHNLGQLSKMFAQGHPAVSESLVFMASDGNHSAVLQKRYLRHGADIEWLGVVSHDSSRSQMDGLVIDALEASFGFPTDPWAGFSFLADMRVPALLEGTGFYGEPFIPRRNDLCPCGSGRKSKVCHW